MASRMVFAALFAGAVIGVAACSGSATPGALQAAQPPAAGALDRTVLPIPEPTYPPVTELDARNAKPPAALRGEGAGGRAQRARSS